MPAVRGATLVAMSANDRVIPDAGETIVIRKILYDGQPSYTWEGTVTVSTGELLVIEATFNRGPRDFGYMVLEPGDLFVEFYYLDQWFNVFQIFSAQGDLKGWYCNIGRPPRLVEGELHYVDLALDLFVYPDGRQLVLDEDEFEELRSGTYASIDSDGALQGLAELQQWASDGRLPSRASASA